MTRRKNSYKRKAHYAALGVVALLALQPFVIAPPKAHADTFDEQVKALEQKIQLETSKKNEVVAQAGEGQRTVADLIDQLSLLNASMDQTASHKQNVAAEASLIEHELSNKKEQLAAQFGALYMEEESLTPLEMLASSKNLSDFMDRQEYRNRIKSQVADRVTEVEAQQIKLTAKQKEIAALLKEQTQQHRAVEEQKHEARSKLGVSEAELAGIQGSINQKSSAVAALRIEQKAANSSLLDTPAPAVGNAPTPAPPAPLPSSPAPINSGGRPGGGQPVPVAPPPTSSYPTAPKMLVVYGPGVSGGGYPSRWAVAAQDSLVDSWGMYNRECVSYTAFKVSQRTRMPHWGGRGNANQWPANARSAGIAVDGNPRVGDVAISMAGYYGHAMYVEAVYPNGLIKVSQYNFYVNGEYSEMVTSAAKLQFIHF